MELKTKYFVGKLYVAICSATQAILLQLLKLENFPCLPLVWRINSCMKYPCYYQTILKKICLTSCTGAYKKFCGVQTVKSIVLIPQNFLYAPVFVSKWQMVGWILVSEDEEWKLKDGGVLRMDRQTDICDCRVAFMTENWKLYLTILIYTFCFLLQVKNMR